jgi:outer membrane receptor protein involved in Fe transport
MNFDDRFTGKAVGDLLLGLPSQLALTSFTVMDQGQNMYFGFIQDDFKLNSKLTLNLRVRYEFSTSPREKENRFANFNPATGSMFLATDGDLFDRSLIHPDYNNLAPRLGFAYSPTDRWVIRGGYGIFYSHTVRQGREGLLGFNPPSWWTIYPDGGDRKQPSLAALFRLRILPGNTRSNSLLRRCFGGHKTPTSGRLHQHSTLAFNTN